MTHIELRGIDKHFGALHVINDLNLVVEDKEFIVLLGQSGCGKTTTLRAIAGLETIDEGDILLDGKTVQHMQASERDIAFVFQSFSLYPHMTVFENIAFPLKAMRVNHAEITERVKSLAKTLQISDLVSKRPSALSGGDMQRVAIGRALVRQPKAMLMDEPIGALDAKLREEMRAEIKRLHIKQGSTTIYVTHDQVEAMSLADRIVVMHEGILQQIGTPSSVYERPENMFVAQFVGSPVMNVVAADVGEEDGHAHVNIGGDGLRFAFPTELTGKLSAANGQKGNLSLGVRPEGVLVSREERDGYVAVEAGIIEPLGSHDIVDLKLGEDVLRARTTSGLVPGTGEKVWARIDPTRAHFFDTATGKSLGIAF